MSSPPDQSAGCLSRSLNWVVKKWPYVLGLIVLIVIIIIITLLFTVYQVTPRIIGGQDAPLGKYPYIASMRILGTHHCGGSILNKRWILTAAHCIADLDAKFLKRLVTWKVGINLLDDNNGQDYYVKDWIPHENYTYNYLTISNDIALVSVKKDIEFSDRVKPITLTKQDVRQADYPVTAIGWGYTMQHGSDTPNALQEITLKILHHRKCQKIWMNYYLNIKDSHICTLTKSGEGTCGGDSGGPLVADGVQIGVVSFGFIICAKGRPDVYARVYRFLDWIEERSKISD